MWNLKKFGDNTALIEDNGLQLSYRQVLEETDNLIANIKERCLVFCLCKNTIGSILGYIAFVNNKIVPLMLNSNLDSDLRNILIKTYCPKFLWIPKELAPEFNSYNIVYEAYGYVLLKTDFSKEYPMHKELGLLLTTSGSTGSAKFVRQFYSNILDNAQNICKYLELDENEKPITTLPMNYTYGLSIINSHLLVGARLLITEKGLMQKEFWNFFKEEGATSFGGVPYTYEMLDRIRFFRMDLPSLTTMTQAGGKILPELHEKFAEYAQKTGRKFVVMYGQCEATARMGYLPANMAVEKRGAMGISIPGGRFYLIDENGQEIDSPNITGELCYEGKNVTAGYAEVGEDLIKGDERHGLLVTGDMAKCDEDGYYYIVGRKKRFLKIYGNRVNLDETDRMIMEEFKIEAVSTGKDDHMYIFITDESYAEKVKKYIVEKTHLNSAAFKVVTIEEIPRNDSGKTKYVELEKYYE